MESASPAWLDYVTAVGAVATPLLVLGLTAIGWRIRVRMERQMELADKLRADRMEIYDTILQPFIILFMPEAAWDADPKVRKKNKEKTGAEILLSLDYRRQAFRLSLIANDGVVRAFNDLLQHFYHLDSNVTASDSDTRTMLALLGKLLLEIRRSSGNEQTTLSNWEMLEWWMTDARRLADPS